jgi:hypothetical protein
MKKYNVEFNKFLLAVAFVFIAIHQAAASTFTFTNPAPVTINDFAPASPYPATIIISGLTAAILDINVVLNGLSHTFPSDIGVLLVGPGGQKVVLMDGAGGSTPMTRRHQDFPPAGRFLPEALGRPIFFRLTSSIHRRWLRGPMGRCCPFSIIRLRMGPGVCLSETFSLATVEASAAASDCRLQLPNLRLLNRRHSCSTAWDL